MGREGANRIRGTSREFPKMRALSDMKDKRELLGTASKGKL